MKRFRSHIGDLSLLDNPRRVAIVGSRRTTYTGLDTAERFARSCAAAGYLVVSGGAPGIDTSAHYGALEGGGSTVFVLPTGINTYKRGTRDFVSLAEVRDVSDAKENILIVSEFADDAPFTGERALARNESIVRSAGCVIVIDCAGRRSGTASTARHALRLGVPLFVAAPKLWGVQKRYPKGNQYLIEAGATPIEDIDDIAPVWATSDIS